MQHFYRNASMQFLPVMIKGKRLCNAAVDASDGHIGSVYDLYFDNDDWTIRYLVVDTGGWLPGRKVLLVPEVILSPWHGETAISTTLTKEQVRSSTDIDTQRIPRTAEQLLHNHYGWIPYWVVPGVPVPLPPPQTSSSAEDRPVEMELAERRSDPHLRSGRAIGRCHVQASDGEAVGHVADFLLDDDIRRILFLVVDVEEWLLEKKVLLPPRLVTEIDCANSRIDVDTSSRAIKASQEYEPAP
jgi:uncharacterized protein YrrD